MKARPRKAEWATLQQLVIRYQGLIDGPADAPERTALRDQICRHVAGVFLDCQGEQVEPAHGAGSEPGARLVRRDSLLEKLIKEELAHHTRRSGGQRLLQAAHGGTEAFAPVAAQVFLQDRSLKTKRAATFLTAVLDGYSGTGSLEGFMRLCVRNFLADMAEARKPLQRAARNPERRALLQGDAPPFEQQDDAGGDDDAQRDEGALASSPVERDEAGHNPTQWAAEMAAFRRAVSRLWDGLDDLDQAVLGQLLGWDEAVKDKALAARFAVSPSAVSQCKTRLLEQLRQAMGVAP